MSIVAITGAGGYIGRQLTDCLEKAAWCERIIGSDIVEPAVQSSKFQFFNKDIRDPRLIDLWRDKKVDTVVHLAFVLNPIHDEQKMFGINVNGTLNVLEACKALNIKHIGVVKLSEVGALVGKRTLNIPKQLYTGIVGLLWRLRVKVVETPAGIVDYIAYPWVLDTERAKQELGWQPRYTSRETLRIMLETHDYRLCT